MYTLACKELGNQGQTVYYWVKGGFSNQPLKTWKTIKGVIGGLDKVYREVGPSAHGLKIVRV